MPDANTQTDDPATVHSLHLVVKSGALAGDAAPTLAASPASSPASLAASAAEARSRPDSSSIAGEASASGGVGPSGQTAATAGAGPPPPQGALPAPPPFLQVPNLYVGGVDRSWLSPLAGLERLLKDHCILHWYCLCDGGQEVGKLQHCAPTLAEQSSL